MCCSVGADDPVRPDTAQRCHSEPELTLAWESVPRARRRGTPLASLCEGGGAKRRRERRNTQFSPPVGFADSPLPEGAKKTNIAAYKTFSVA